MPTKLAFLLTAAALLGGNSPEVQSDQWLCEGVARGSHGAIVIVHFYAADDGTVIDRGVAWTPPTTSRKVSGRSLAALDLMVSYDHADRINLGAPSVIDASVLSRESLGFLDDSIVVLGLQRTLFTGKFDVSGTTKGGVQYRSATLASDSGNRLAGRFANAAEGHLLVASAIGKPLASIVYDFSARRERDRLFRAAWDEAEQKLARPTQCDRTSSDAGTISVAAR